MPTLTLYSRSVSVSNWFWTVILTAVLISAAAQAIHHLASWPPLLQAPVFALCCFGATLKKVREVGFTPATSHATTHWVIDLLYWITVAWIIGFTLLLAIHAAPLG